jgi:phosphotransferase system  glucose/maltose/N-acetylglucosamine-specific IIC component
MVIRPFTYVVALAAFCAALTYRAALVQGADPQIAWAGVIIGGIMGALLAFRKTNLGFVGGILGTLGVLQIETWYPDDCGNIIMPLIGFFFGALVGCLCDRFLAIDENQTPVES